MYFRQYLNDTRVNYVYLSMCRFGAGRRLAAHCSNEAWCCLQRRRRRRAAPAADPPGDRRTCTWVQVLHSSAYSRMRTTASACAEAKQFSVIAGRPARGSVNAAHLAFPTREESKKTKGGLSAAATLRKLCAMAEAQPQSADYPSSGAAVAAGRADRQCKLGFPECRFCTIQRVTRAATGNLLSAPHLAEGCGQPLLVG